LFPEFIARPGQLALEFFPALEEFLFRFELFGFAKRIGVPFGILENLIARAIRRTAPDPVEEESQSSPDSQADQNGSNGIAHTDRLRRGDPDPAAAGAGACRRRPSTAEEGPVRRASGLQAVA
jgi:hypothetical protein